MKNIVTSIVLFILMTGCSASMERSKIPDMTPPPAADNIPAAAQRARGPGLELALEAARAASARCSVGGYSTTVIVIDSGGVAVVLLSADGAKPKSVTGVPQKARTALKYMQSSGEVAMRVKSEPALAAEIAADPTIVSARQGAVPLMSGKDVIGAIGVSGGPSGEIDETCAKAGRDAVNTRL